MLRNSTAWCFQSLAEISCSECLRWDSRSSLSPFLGVLRFSKEIYGPLQGHFKMQSFKVNFKAIREGNSFECEVNKMIHRRVQNKLLERAPGKRRSLSDGDHERSVRDELDKGYTDPGRSDWRERVAEAAHSRPCWPARLPLHKGLPLPLCIPSRVRSPLVELLPYLVTAELGRFQISAPSC